MKSWNLLRSKQRFSSRAISNLIGRHWQQSRTPRQTVRSIDRKSEFRTENLLNKGAKMFVQNAFKITAAIQELHPVQSHWCELLDWWLKKTWTVWILHVLIAMTETVKLVEELDAGVALHWSRLEVLTIAELLGCCTGWICFKGCLGSSKSSSPSNARASTSLHFLAQLSTGWPVMVILECVGIFMALQTSFSQDGIFF